jgi:RNA recognition motif-containing protein
MVETVKLITNRQTGRLCGFGFVEMASGANEAIAALNSRELRGSRLNIQYPAKCSKSVHLDRITGEVVPVVHMSRVRTGFSHPQFESRVGHNIKIACIRHTQ